MASERMMQAMGRLEQALSFIESLPAQSPPEIVADPAPADIALRVQAQETLQRLDSVIADLKGLADG